MNAIVMYSLETGEDGWYICRNTVVVRNNTPVEIIDRRPVAVFSVPPGAPSTEDTANGISFNEAINNDELVLLPRGWDFELLESVLKRKS